MTEPTASIPDGELSSEDQEAGDSPALNKDESPAVADDSSYHLLEGRWTFWYTHRPTTLRNSSINYDSCLKKLGLSPLVHRPGNSFFFSSRIIRIHRGILVLLRSYEVPVGTPVL